ncbi:UvsW [Candidatus Woesearchaeota archaeon]|jgi:superfamily II DNA or RNA helicase|nr:UvsW [Candidatus Woesearchaeota archaeon]|tara:strand:+ start:1196 stop:2659 length:1464 start_codon:yes stop_codon:yes gene_type:complete
MSDLVIQKSNEVFLKVDCEPHIKYELRDHFSFEIPNKKFMPQYRNKHWDGFIRLYDVNKGTIYAGLLDKVIGFCKNYNYSYSFEDNKYYGLPFEENQMVSKEGVRDYMRSISRYEPRDYQIEGVHDALKCNRRLLISPTASGKSMMIYSLVRYYVAKKQNILIVVPTTSLVEQMHKDFADYGWDSDTYCHKIYGGKELETDKVVTITTWQSVYKLDRKYFEKFNVVIGDEAHLFKSKSLISIMTKLHHAKYRFGFTGTLDGTQTHKWVLEGLFGPSYKVTRTDELMRQGHLSQLDIQCLVLKHNSQRFETYEDEIQYLIGHEQRNNFITNLSLDLKGNTLVLYSRVESHGEIIFNMINNRKVNDRKTFFIHGGVGAEERENVRSITERESDAIIVASYGTFSTGINIKNLHNVVFASPSKSRIRNLQSIGRVLRKGKNKTKAVLYDIADDCNYKSRKNYTLNHFIERIKTYNEENFNYEILTINLRS